MREVVPKGSRVDAHRKDYRLGYRADIERLRALAIQYMTAIYA
jgi:hypothetical protein